MGKYKEFELDPDIFILGMWIIIIFMHLAFTTFLVVHELGKPITDIHVTSMWIGFMIFIIVLLKIGDKK